MAENSIVTPARTFTLLLLAVMLSSGFVSVSNAALPIGSVGPTCIGDCNNSGAVTVDEVVNGVNIALGTLPLDQCSRFDCNGMGQVTVDCIVKAVSAALKGCQSPPTSTATQNTGTFLTKWGTLGSGDGQFANPVGVAVDQNLNVYVSDFFNDRIQKFTNTGTFLAKWGSRGSGNGQFINARNVAVGEGPTVFAVDDGNDRIEVFTDSGTFLAAWGSPGTADGQFNSVTAVAVDANGEILATDESQRVQRFACPPPNGDQGHSSKFGDSSGEGSSTD